MKVICFINNLCSGGGQRQLVNLSIALKHAGHDISFLTYHENDFYLHYLIDEEIEEHRLDCKTHLSRMIRVRKYLRSADVDVVISFLDTPNFLACFSAIGKHNWKLITNELSAKKTSFVGKRARIFKGLERFSDWTVCNSQNAKKMWIEHYPQYQKRISTIYNPVNMPSEILSLAASYEGQERKRLVIAASYQYLKNPIGLIEAVNLLSSEERQKLTIDWYGRQEINPGYRGPYEEAKELVQKYGLSQTIILHDETQTIYREMARADAVGLFSTVEGLPNVICEGMMIGKAIIMSRVSDYEVLVTDANGYLCDAGDIKSIAEALRRFINTSLYELKEMGMKSREIAIKLFSPEYILSQWEDLLNMLKQ